jgi:hypothetical protein
LETQFSLDEEQIEILQNLAKKNIENSNGTIRAHAANLLRLVFSQEDQGNLINQQVLASSLSSYSNIPSPGYDKEALMTFYKNFPQNIQELLPAIIELIQNKINSNQNK